MQTFHTLEYFKGFSFLCSLLTFEPTRLYQLRVFGDLVAHLVFDDISHLFVTRCLHLHHTHVLFESRSPTTGMLHILPNGLVTNEHGQIRWRLCNKRLPFEYTFQHELHHVHYNYHMSQRHTSRLQRILANSVYPIGRSCGTFYKTLNGHVVLVSPTVPDVGRIMTSHELNEIEGLRCSFVDLVPGEELVLLVQSVLDHFKSTQNYLMICGEQRTFPDIPGVVQCTEETPPTNIDTLFVYNAHQCRLTQLPRSRYIICIAPSTLQHIERLTCLCGINYLPFPPLEPHRDLCIHTPCPQTPPIYQIQHIEPVQNKPTPCSVCLSDTMNRPMMLSCHHVFCFACVHELTTRHGTTAKCPLCRCIIVAPIISAPCHVSEKSRVIQHLLEQSRTRICLLTASEQCAQHYARVFGSAVHVYGFGRCVQTPPQTRVLICNIYMYDYYVYDQCTHVYVHDLPSNPYTLHGILVNTKNDVCILLEQNSLEETMYKTWIRSYTNTLYHDSTYCW